MLFEDRKLRELISQTVGEIEVRNAHGRVCSTISPERALALDLNLFVGVGNRRRLRFLRPRTQVFVLNEGSRTTRRVRNDASVNVAHPLIREHRPIGPR